MSVTSFSAWQSQAYCCDSAVRQTSDSDLVTLCSAALLQTIWFKTFVWEFHPVGCCVKSFLPFYYLRKSKVNNVFNINMRVQKQKEKDNIQKGVTKDLKKTKRRRERWQKSKSNSYKKVQIDTLAGAWDMNWICAETKSNATIKTPPTCFFVFFSSQYSRSNIRRKKIKNTDKNIQGFVINLP